jgi:hypothetical protein
MGAPARIERARVGSKPTALPLSYGAVTEAAGLEPASGCGRLRASNALPFQLGHASRGGRRGSRTPKARGPTRFRDGIPRPWQSFQMVTPAGFEPALPRVRAGSSPLSYGAMQCGRQGSNLRRPAFQAGALPTELRPRGRRGWTRTSSLLFVRQALFAIELLAYEVPREGVEPSRAWPTALSTPRVYRSATPTRSSGTRDRTSISTFRAWCPTG